MINPELKKKLEALEDALLDLAVILDCETTEVLQNEGLMLGDSQDGNYPSWYVKIVPTHWRDRLA